MLATLRRLSMTVEDRAVGTIGLCPEGTTGLSLGFQPQVPVNKTPRPEGAVELARRVRRG
jgi:hypothetical protein